MDYQCTNEIPAAYWRANPYEHRIRRCGVVREGLPTWTLFYFERMGSSAPVLKVDVTALCGPCANRTMRERWPAEATVCEHWETYADGTRMLASRDFAAPVVVDRFNSERLLAGRSF